MACFDRRGPSVRRDQSCDVSVMRSRGTVGLAAFGLLLPGCARPTAPPPPRFRSVSRALGIDFTHENGASGPKYFVETMGAGVSFLDYDNDGWLDILCVN